jgi:hypothetical protein
MGTSVLADNPGTLNQESVQPVFKGDPNHPKLDQVTRANEIPVANRTVPTDEGIVEITGSAPVKPSVPAPFCDNLAYYAGTLGYFWGLPSAFWGDHGTRFTTPAGIACTVQVAWVLLYGDAMTGDPDLSVTIYDDNGFDQPGTALETIVVPNASLPTSGVGWVGVAFTIPHIFGEYGSDVDYFVVYDAIVDDTLDLIGLLTGDGTDNPFDGEGRSGGYRFSAGQWMSFLGQYGPGSDFDIIQDVDRCCFDLPFTDCNFQAWHGGAYYIWSTPHPTYGDSEWSTRFSVSGPETLKSVRVSVYDRSGTQPPPYIPGDDDLIIRVYDDDGFGYPGTLLHTETVTGGTYPFYPAWTDVPMSVPLVFEDDFHVSFGSSATFGSGDYEVLMGDDGATGNGDGIGGSLRTFGAGDPGYASDCGHPVWYEMTCWWGLDAGFFIEAELCKDQFAVCESQFWTAGITSVLLVPDSNPLVEWAQRFMSSGADCRVDELEIVLYRHPVDVGVRPLMYTHDTWINIYTDAGGVPGSLINTYVLTPADYAAAGYTGDPFTGFLVFTIPTNDVIGGTSFWVGVQPQTAIPAEGIRVVADNDGGGGNVLGLMVDLGGGGNWLSASGGFGWASDAAMEMTAKICCIPFDEQDCAALLPDPNWNNLSHDQGRTGRTGNELGDAWCDLNLVWNYQSPTDRTWYTGATIYNGKVACSFGDHYVVFDLATGAPSYVLSGVPALDPTPEELGNTLRCAPFITSVASLAGIDVMFVGGGSEQSIYAYNFATGAMIWKRSFLSVGLAGLYGTTRYVPFLYYEALDGATDVIVWVTDNGRIVAADAATGTRFRVADGYASGWATVPVILGSGVTTAKTGATDGTSMFFGTAPGTGNGDVYSVDVATGAVNWTLSTSGGLQAVALWTAFGGIDNPVPDLEQFNSGIAYDNGRLYFVSYLGQGEHPSEGAFYRVNAADGSLVGGSATLARPGIWFLNAGTPVIDVNRVYVPGLSRWAVSPTEQLAAYSKATGASLWQLGGPTNGGHRADIALTCEPDGAPDLLLVFDDEGFFRVVNSVDGDEIFRRRVHSPGGAANDIGMAIAVGTDGDGDEWVVASDFYGNLMAMEKQEGMDRPRLEILSYRPQVPVEFGTNTAFVVSLGQLLTNTGCTDLTVSNLIVDENPPADATVIPNFSAQIVDPSVAYRAANLADMLTDDSFKTMKNVRLNSIDEMALSRDKDREVAPTNKAAAAPPAWFVSISTDLGLPAVIPAGDTAEILVTADQTQITRGPLPIYITVVSDDPDFFINGIVEPTNMPVINATIVGGCLLDTTTLLYGAGGANIQWVTNCGRFGTGDWTPHAIEVDGESNYVFQGTYIFGVSPFRIAINTQDWGSGGEESSWISWQPDPNYCDDLCEPTATAAVLGMITADGLTYTAIDGHIVCKSAVDSVQNFDDGGGGWDWTIYTAPFDNDSSMGLYINSRVAGADDGTPLTTNVTVEIFEFTERNGNALPGWKFGAHIDCDILVDAGGDHDTVWIDRSISTAWASAYPAATHAFGWIKLPFGCVEGWDSNPVKNVVGLDSDQGLFEDTLKYDSFYFFMSQPPGATYGQTMADAAQDQQFLTTIIEHDFAPNEVLEFAVMQFARGDLANAHSSAELVDQALFANKWLGFGRGDVNNDNTVNLGDIMHLAYYLADTGTNPGPIPFMHLGDVNADGNVDGLDLDYLIAYYFDCGPCPTGDWAF